jgi:starch synthase (maltosyl-transferring)
MEKNSMSATLIYNIFPLLAGKMDQWIIWAKKAKEMGFTWIYINPIQTPGFSGSIYSIKDYYAVNPLFINDEVYGAEKTGYEEMEQVLREISFLGLRVVTDLVINHTAIDCPLALEHPSWYKKDEDGNLEHPSAIDPADSRNVTVWGDLYEIDNEKSEDKEALWKYWEALVETQVLMGVRGFRCDAAYKVPSELWKRLILKAEKIAGEKIPFLAETLGCRLEEIESLKGAGFSFLYNSSKYWNFDSPWVVEQHKMFKAIAPSIAFAESHDTPRLFSETNGAVNVMKQRYAFGLAFSKGFQVTMGFEYGWKTPCDVVKSRVGDQEESSIDLTKFIKNINELSTTLGIFNEEGVIKPLTEYDREVLIIEKSSQEENKSLYVLINKNWNNSNNIELPFPMLITRPFGDKSVEWLDSEGVITLEPAEVIYGVKEDQDV